MVACILHLLLLCISKDRKRNVWFFRLYCNLCSRVIKKINERVLLSYGWKKLKYLCDRKQIRLQKLCCEIATPINISLNLWQSKILGEPYTSTKLPFKNCWIIYFDVLFVSQIRDRLDVESSLPWAIATAILQREHRTEQSIRSDRKALENTRFTVARGQIYKYFDLQEIFEASFPTQVENYWFQTARLRLWILFANLLL